MEQTEPTVDSIRSELRSAIFQGLFFGCAHEIEGHSGESENAKLAAQNFAAFGINAGLITSDEGNDWLSAAKGESSLAEVATKWDAMEE